MSKICHYTTQEYKCNTRENFNSTVPITICIPCFPRDTPKLEKCINSIMNQTVHPEKVIVGHSEFTKKQAKKLEEKYKNDKFDFKCVSTRKKQYAAKNRNMVAKKVDTDYIGFFDADDIMYPERIETIWKQISKHKPLCLIHGFNDDYNKKRKLNKVVFGKELYDKANKTKNERLWIYPGAHHGHPTIHKSVFDKVKQNESKEFRRGQDSKYLRDILNHFGRNNKTMIFIDIPLVYYIAAENQ